MSFHRFTLSLLLFIQYLTSTQGLKRKRSLVISDSIGSDLTIHSKDEKEFREISSLDSYFLDEDEIKGLMGRMLVMSTSMSYSMKITPVNEPSGSRIQSPSPISSPPTSVNTPTSSPNQLFTSQSDIIDSQTNDPVEAIGEAPAENMETAPFTLCTDIEEEGFDETAVNSLGYRFEAQVLDSGDMSFISSIESGVVDSMGSLCSDGTRNRFLREKIGRHLVQGFSAGSSVLVGELNPQYLSQCIFSFEVLLLLKQ